MMRTSSRPACLLAWLGLLAASTAGAHAPPAWSQLEFVASKFFMTGRAEVELRRLPAAEVAPALLATPEGRPVQPGSEVLELVYRASGFGRESVTTLWADPVSGATLQRTELDSGSRQRWRSYRFTDIGAYHYTRWPATNAEKPLPPERWTERSQGLRAYSPSAVGQAVTEPTMLLWLAAAGDYQHAGDRGEVLAFSRKRVNRVTLEVTGRRALRVDFEERNASGSRQRRGSVDAIVMRIRGQPVDATGDDDDDFELLGLRGDLELLIDPATRAPLQLSGNVKIAGHVTARLRRARIR